MTNVFLLLLKHAIINFFLSRVHTGSLLYSYILTCVSSKGTNSVDCGLTIGGGAMILELFQGDISHLGMMGSARICKFAFRKTGFSAADALTSEEWVYSGVLKMEGMEGMEE